MCINQSNEQPLIRHLPRLQMCETFQTHEGASRAGQRFSVSEILSQLHLIHSASSVPQPLASHQGQVPCRPSVTRARYRWSLLQMPSALKFVRCPFIQSHPFMVSQSLDLIDISQPATRSLSCFSGPSSTHRNLYIALLVNIGFNIISYIRVSYRLTDMFPYMCTGECWKIWREWRDLVSFYFVVVVVGFGENIFYLVGFGFSF